MKYFEVYGYHFQAEGSGLDENSAEFATALNRIRETLLQVSQPELERLHEAGLIPDNGHIEDTWALDKLVELGDRAAGLPDGEFIGVIPLEKPEAED